MQAKDNEIHNPFLMQEAANKLAALDCSVIPVKFNKQPNVPTWKPFQEKIPDAFQINDMFSKDTFGIAIIGGRVSGHLEALDEDLKYDITGTMHEEFVSLLREQAPGLYEKLLIQKTTNGGYHYIFRCSSIEGNLKLSSRPATEAEQQKHPQEKQKVLYETRGEGGYFVCAPTQGYEIIQGSFANIPGITPEERDILLSTARSFDQCQKEFTPTRHIPESNFTGLSSFKDYNQKADVVSLLHKHGWTTVSTRGAKTFLKRPGDTNATQSANFDSEKNWFTVFSTSTEFETQKAYQPYAVYAVLECGGDFSLASKKLYEDGYGDRRSISNNTTSRNNVTNSTIVPDLDMSQIVINSVDLLKLDTGQDRYLLAPIIPKVGTGVLAGMPDTGKSQFARQLCISISSGMNHFLDYGLTTTFKRALYLATEDDDHNTSFLLKKQLDGLGQPPTEDLSFVFADILSQEEILQTLDKHLTDQPCDLVVVDSFGDVFAGNDSNNNAAMRNTAKIFDRIAKKHQCFLLFVHHTTKGSYKQAPHQMHIMGGAGLVQKARLALLLSQDESGIKYLTVVKGNYCPQEHKQHAMELDFNKDTFIFKRTGRNVPKESLNQDTGKDKDTKFSKLVNLADEIFGTDAISYKVFCEQYENITGKAQATAKRDHRAMKDLEIIIQDETTKHWKLNSTQENIVDLVTPKEPPPF